MGHPCRWRPPVVKEEFRINERTTPPDANEVELCRIHLTSNTEPLQQAIDVFNPASQCLDLRYRRRAQARAKESVQVGVLSSQSDDSLSLSQRWSALLQSLPGLYPALTGNPNIQAISLREPTSSLFREVQVGRGTSHSSFDQKRVHSSDSPP